MTLPATLIRPLEAGDAESFVALRSEALLDSPFSFGSAPGYDRASVEFVHRAVADPDAAIFGAFEPELVGTVGIYRQPSPKTGHHAHVWGMYVTPGHRGKGLGRALMNAAIEFARSLDGVTDVQLGVSERAAAAAGLYESLGFVTWGVEPAALRIDGEEAAEHYMVLALNQSAD